MTDIDRALRHYRGVLDAARAQKQDAPATVLAHDDPLVLRLPGGEISVSFDGEHWTRFKSSAHYDHCLEQLDREQVAFGAPAVDEYHSKVQALQAERRAWERYRSVLDKEGVCPLCRVEPCYCDTEVER